MKTIVLIDDNKDSLQFLREAMNADDADIQCLSFVFADEAVAGLLNGVIERPFSIFINLDLRGASGLQSLQELRSARHLDNTPIVAYASSISDEIALTLQEAGLVLTFHKPNTIRAWKDVVRETLTSIQVPDLDMEALIAHSRNQLFFTS